MFLPRGVITNEMLHYWNGSKREVWEREITPKLIEMFSQMPKEDQNPVLVRILENESLSFDACDGTRTMANAKDVFTGWVDGDWKNYGLCNHGPATPATPAIMYELVKGAKFKEFFMSLGFSLDAMCVTESQSIGFAKKYPHLIRKCSTFMLIKKDWNKPAMQTIDGVKNFDNVFVARAYRASDGLLSYVHFFEHDNVWYADFPPRVLVPQLAD